jgi:sodium-dependent phosphate cotransporter
MVGSGVLGVEQAIYFIYGANIGTSVTNSIVCFSFIGNPENYRRGFAAASVHDMFNLMNVALWFPLEWISDAINGGNGGVMYLITEAMTSRFEGGDGEEWTSPFKTITRAITDKMIKVNKGVLEDYSQGRPAASQCGAFLCVGEFDCQPYQFNAKGCSDSPFAVNSTQCLPDGSNAKVKAEFAFCQNAYGDVDSQVLDAAQIHFDAGEPNSGGIFYPMQTSAGIICFVIALFMMFSSMILMVKFLNRLVRGPAQTCVKKALNTNGYLGILIGVGVTMLVQSSSITTATLTPMAAIGLVSLESKIGRAHV